MKIQNINIANFRSIHDLSLPIQEYGTGKNQSKSTFLVGINESGKSAILDAIGLLNDGIEDINYEENCSLNAQDENDFIEIYADVDIEWLIHGSFWKEKMSENTILDKTFIDKIKIESVSKIILKNKDDVAVYFEILVNENLPLYQYIKNTTSKTLNGKVQTSETIENLANFNGISDDIDSDNIELYLRENQKILTKDELESYLSESLDYLLNHNMPNIQVWKPKPEYLINEAIDLKKFKDDPNISIPLKNIFRIYGKTTDEEIKNTIEKALSNQARCDELRAKMSEKVTKYINRIWKEHKIKIRISINSNICKVHVEDNDKKYAYYTMHQRSEGFKHFLSLIFSISVENDTKELKDNIILIDEPEIHLHPSGVRYLRDEILNIGKNNNVIISTHSHYMIDTDVPERHWIVQKEKSETKITQISGDTSITDDKVISTAFGLNLFKELLPKNIIIVEGCDDKNIISHSMSILHKHFKYSIKASGGASKAPGFARLLSDENIHASILFDADKEGKDSKKKILDSQIESYTTSNVFTLKDILTNLPDNSTIEDLMPIEFVKTFFEKTMEQAFELSTDKAVIIQLKNQSNKLKTNKQKLDSLKVELSKEFCNKFNKKIDIEKNDRLSLLTTQLIERIEKCEQY
jgi:predicted ATP-dependent endonuclease of OLD family